MNSSIKLLISAGYVLAIALFWAVLTFEHWLFVGDFRFLKGIGSLAGVIGYTLFSLSLFLSSRWDRLENWLGGLDQIYHLHRKVGIWGFCFIVAHPLILSLKKFPPHLIHDLLPFHKRLSMNLGSISFWLMILLLGITLLKLLPYHRWKVSHKGMSLVFLLASFHFLLSHHLIAPSSGSKILLSLPFGIGLLSIFYKQFLFYFKKTYKYTVTKTKILNHNTIEIFIEPNGHPISFISGQYAFFSFQGSHVTSESHPFTLCGEENGSKNSILVKNRGDFTQSLFSNVKAGNIVDIEGPHGRFDFKSGGNSQIWIGGGIGIVPFLCWSRLLETQSHQKEIYLFYCVHEKKDLIDPEHFTNLSKKLKHFHFIPIYTGKEGHLKANHVEKIAGSLYKHTILMCGPKAMTRELRNQLIDLGVRKNKIIFEDFEFF